MKSYRVLAALIAVLVVALAVQGLTDSPVVAGGTAIAFLVVIVVAVRYHRAAAGPG